MAITPDKVQIGTSSDYLDGVSVDTSAGNGLFRETVVAADPENGEGLARVLNSAPASDAYGSVVRPIGQPNLVGTWGYQSGVSGSVAVPSGARVLEITCTAGISGATLTINGGDSIIISPYDSFTTEPKGNLVAPSLVFTGTSQYFVSRLT